MKTEIVTTLTMKELEDIVNDIFPKANYNYKSSDLAVVGIEATSNNVCKYSHIYTGDFPSIIHQSPEMATKFFSLVTYGTDQGWMDIMILAYLVWADILPAGKFYIVLRDAYYD